MIYSVVDSRNGSRRGVRLAMCGWVGGGRRNIDAMLHSPLKKCFFFFLLFLTFFFSFYFSPPRTDSAATAAALALAGVGDEDLLGGLAALGPEGLDLEGSEVQTLREKVHYCCGSSEQHMILDWTASFYCTG